MKQAIRKRVLSILLVLSMVVSLFPTFALADTVNQAPTDILLSNSTIAENGFINTYIGTLSAVDADAGDTFTFELFSNGIDANENFLFNIIGSDLYATSAYDYETQPSIPITVRVTDNGGSNFSKNFAITVTDIGDEKGPLLDNGLVRMGDSGDVRSISSSALLNEPSQYIYNSSGFRIDALTDGDDLVDEIGVGGDGTNEWNLNGKFAEVRALKNVTLDRSGFVPTGDGKGYGTLITNGNLEIGDTVLNVTKEYTLGQCTPFVKVKTTLKNIGTSTASNLRYWSSIVYDDELNDDNSPDLKQQGTLAAGIFSESTLATERTNAVKVTDGSATNLYNLLTYTPDPKGIAMISDSGGSVYTADTDDIRLYYSLTAMDPFSRTNSSIEDDSGSFGFFKRMNDLSVGETDSFESYFGGSHRNTISFDDMASMMQNGSTSTNVKCVSFKSNGGTPIASKTFEPGSTVTKPTDPTKTEAEFIGWYTDEALTTSFDFATPVSESFTLYAKWKVVNQAPTDISLSASSIAENAASDTTVGTLSATDANDGDTFTYEWVAGDGDTDNTSFTIDGANLKTAASFDFETKSSYSIRIQATDAGSLTFAKSLTVSVTDVNEAPTDISLSSTSYAENQPVGTTVGTFSATDADAGDTATFELVSGEGDTDNPLFEIDGTSLKTKESADYELEKSYSIRVKVTDAGSLTYEKAFAISVTDANEAPTDLSLSTSSIAENAGVNAAVGTLSGTDADAVSTLTYSLATGDGDTDNGSFNIDGNSLKATNSFDFETKSSYSVRVQVSDGSLTYAESFTITVTDVNEAPTDLTLSTSSIAENAGANAAVGTLSGTDEDAVSTLTYSLATGDGDTDNGSFNMDGVTLRATNSFDFETKSSYSVRVQVSDGSLTYEESFTITVTDANETPTDISLSASSIAENAGANAAVGALGGTDPDAGASLTFSLIAGEGDTDNGMFTVDGNALKATISFDFETKTSYSARVQVSDGSLTYAESFAITVTDVNEAPTDISMSTSSIAENAGANAIVGTIGGTDPDAGATLTYSLVTGDGDTDNASFTIDGTTLKANDSFDFETKTSYSIRVQVSDGELTYDEALTISVTDIQEAPTFVDVPFTAWHSPAVEYLAKMTILAGDGKGNFNPNRGLTRAEFVKMVVSSFDINPSSTDGISFSDTKNEKAWHYLYIDLANRAKIISGFPDGTFRPNAVLTRQEMIVILHRAIMYKELSLSTSGPSLSSFKDADKVSKFAQTIIDQMTQANIMTGNQNMLRPAQDATRAEGASVIYRVLNRLAG